MNATPDGRIDELTDKNDPDFLGINLERKLLRNQESHLNDIFRSQKVEKNQSFFCKL